MFTGRCLSNVSRRLCRPDTSLLTLSAKPDFPGQAPFSGVIGMNWNTAKALVPGIPHDGPARHSCNSAVNVGVSVPSTKRHLRQEFNHACSQYFERSSSESVYAATHRNAGDSRTGARCCSRRGLGADGKGCDRSCGACNICRINHHNPGTDCRPAGSARAESIGIWRPPRRRPGGAGHGG